MGKAYKLYEKAAYWALDWGYESGKVIDNARIKKEYDKAYEYLRSNLNYGEFDDNFTEVIQEARDMFGNKDKIGNKRQRGKARHYE